MFGRLNGLRDGVWSSTPQDRPDIRAAMQIRNGQRTADVTDPLAALDDAFDGVALDPKWSIYKPASLEPVSLELGHARFAPVQGGPGPTGNFWFDGFDGSLVHQDVSGDFDAWLDCAAYDNTEGAPPPVSWFRIAGLAAHDPNRATFNYVHIGFGSANEPDNRVESKNTINSVSAYTSTSWPTAQGQIRILRVGQLFRTYVRALSTDPWQLEQTYDRTATPMPMTLQLGVICYSNEVAADLVLHANQFTVRTPV